MNSRGAGQCRSKRCDPAARQPPGHTVGMAVLVEGISVVVRISSIQQKFAGGGASFRKLIPHQQFCMDGQLASVNFMAGNDVRAFADELERHGLTVFDGQAFVDVAVVDMHKDVLAPAPWLESVTTGTGVRFVYLADQGIGEVVVPDGWQEERSLYAVGTYVSEEDMQAQVEVVGQSGGVQEVRLKGRDQPQYVGRTSKTPLK